MDRRITMIDDFHRYINIAVVIPVYNCKKYLKDAVNSVLQQPYQTINLVLIDDGSTDSSAELCDELTRTNDRIAVIHQKNSGVSAARNKGIEYALRNYQNNLEKGYIAFLDADDAWMEVFFTYEFIFELSDTDMICFQSVHCNNDMTRYSKLFTMNEGIYSDGNEVISYCLKQHFGSCLYAASFLKQHNIRFNETICYSEDVLFFRKCIRSANRISLYNKPFYLYRNNVSSAVHTRNYGIEYYEPIFEAYLTDDEDGEGFLSWYIVDMIEEHFCHFGTISS